MRACLLVLVLALGGCRYSHADADAFVSPRAGFSDPLWGLALYVPNRLVDALDIVHLSMSFGVGLGYELHLTRYGRLGAMASMDGSAAWLGRFTYPGHLGAYGRVCASVAEYEDATNERGDLARPYRYPRWDIGGQCGLFLFGLPYVAIAPDEILDFIAGVFLLDLKADDLENGNYYFDTQEAQRHARASGYLNGR